MSTEQIKEIKETIDETDAHNAERSTEQIESQNAVATPVNRFADEFARYKSDHERAERGKRRFEITIAVLLIINAVLVFATAIIFYRVLRSSQEASDDAHVAYIATQRPFITMPELRVELVDGLIPGAPGQPGTPVKYWHFTPTFENSGNTLTKDLRIRPLAYLPFDPGPFGLGALQSIVMEAKTLPVANSPPDPADITPPKDIYYNLVIGPHSKITNIGGVGVVPDAIKANSPQWFVDGVVSYNDTFPHTGRHITKYCYVISGIPEIGEQKPQADVCGHWNCTDDECETDKQRYEEETIKTIANPAHPAQK